MRQKRFAPARIAVAWAAREKRWKHTNYACKQSVRVAKRSECTRKRTAFNYDDNNAEVTATTAAANSGVYASELFMASFFP